MDEGITIHSRIAVVESEQRSHAKRCEELDAKRDADRAALIAKVESGFEMMHSRFNTLKKEMNDQAERLSSEMHSQANRFQLSLIALLSSALVGAIWYIVTHQG